MLKGRYGIVIILLVAAYLRLSAITCAEFKGDEALNSFMALDLVRGDRVPLVGDMSSVGVVNPAMFVYLLSVPFVFSANPVVASSYVVLLNLAALWLCFFFCKKFFNKRVALVAALFFATNPWAVLYSRKIWANNLLPLFVLAFVFSLFEVVVNGKSKHLIVVFLSLAVCAQLHPVTACFALLLLAALLICRPRIAPRWLGSGAGLAALLYVPYLAYECTHGFSNLRALLTVSQLPASFHPEALLKPLTLATTSGFFHSLELFPLDCLQALLIVFAIGWAIRNTAQKKFLLMTLWFFTPVAVMLFSKVPLVNHYFISLLPALFILLGIGVDAAAAGLEKRSRWLAHSFYGLVAVLAAYQIVCVLEFNHLVKTHSNIAWMDYGPPLKFRVEEIGRRLQDHDVTAENIQKKLIEGKTPEEAFKYDFLATEYIAENLDFPSGNPLLEVNRGNRFFKKGDLEASLRCYSRAILINPACSLAYDNRGFVLMSQGDLNRAIADFSAALDINPKNPSARLNRATAYSRQNDREKAQQDVQRLQDSGYTVDPHLLEALKP